MFAVAADLLTNHHRSQFVSVEQNPLCISTSLTPKLLLGNTGKQDSMQPMHPQNQAFFYFLARVHIYTELDEADATLPRKASMPAAKGLLTTALPMFFWWLNPIR